MDGRPARRGAGRGALRASQPAATSQGPQGTAHHADQGHRLPGHPVLPQGPGDHHDRPGGHDLVQRQGQEPRLLGDLGQRREEGAEPEPGEHALEEAGFARGRAGDVLVGRLPRDQPDPGEGGGHAHPDEQGRPLAGEQADHDRHEHRADTRDRGDHAHPPRGQPAVEERRTEAVAYPGHDAPGEVGAGGGTVGEEGEHQDQRSPAELGDEGHGPGTRALGRDAADEVGEPVRRGRDQREQDRHVR